jgi:hypothetical protein
MKKEMIIDKAQNIGAGMMMGSISMMIASFIIWSVYGDLLIARFAIACAVVFTLPVMVVHITMIAGIYPDPKKIDLLSKLTYYLLIFPTVDIWSVYGAAHVLVANPASIPSINQYMPEAWPIMAGIYLGLFGIGMIWRIFRMCRV